MHFHLRPGVLTVDFGIKVYVDAGQPLSTLVWGMNWLVRRCQRRKYRARENDDIQGRNHGWKVEGAYVWVPTAPGQRPDWVLGAGGGRPLPLWGSWVSPRENFWKLRC